MTERVEIQYKGFHIVAAHFKGKYQGRAHFQDTIKYQLGTFKLGAAGESIDAVVADLKAQIERWVLDNESTIRNLREERHRQFLESRGIKYQGIRPATKVKFRRVTHCYACKSHLDNSIDTECVACSWILCNCGACGCGWQGHSLPA